MITVMMVRMRISTMITMMVMITVMMVMVNE